MHMRFRKAMVRAHTRQVKGKTVFVPAHRRIDHGTLPRSRMKTNPKMAITPEDLERRFGPEADRFQLRDKDDKPLLVRKFGRGKQYAFAVHDADGTHIATMHVKANKDGARVTAGWTHDKHNRRGAHNALLHRLVSHHGTVTSPTSMHYDLHHAFNTMDDDHELSTERTEGGGGVRYRLQRKQMTLFKGRVKAHWRKLPSGKIVRVREYTNKRTEKAPPAKAPKAAAAASVPYSVRVAPGREHEVTPADAHAVNRHLQVALDWIARAHNLPKLDITVQYGPMGAQEPGMTAAEYDRDRRTMLLSHDAPSTIVHEMAHAIDHQVLGVNRTFGTERWEQWVDQDRAMPSNLQGLSAVMDALAPQSWQKRIREFVDTLPDTDADYVARPSEVFARAYEQYVYTKAARKPADNIDEGRLMLFGRMVRTQALVDKGLYWTDEEFGAIEQAFDRLFAGGGIAKAFCRFVECSVDLFKGRVKAHWRKLPSGKVVRVQEYTNKRTRRPAKAPAAGSGQQTGLFEALQVAPTKTQRTRTAQGPQGSAETGKSGSDAGEEYKRLGTKAPLFKAWFGDWEDSKAGASKVVNKNGEPQETYEIPGTGSVVKDADGKPLVVYHGTSQGRFSAFDKDKLDIQALYGPGMYFTEDQSVAQEYVEKDSETGKAPHVISAFLNIRNPFDLDQDLSSDQIAALADVIEELIAETQEAGETKAGSEWFASSDEDPAGMLREVADAEEILLQPLQDWLKDLSDGFVLCPTYDQPSSQCAEIVQRMGYDGMTHIGGHMLGDGKFHRVWIAFEANQIKAVDNQGTFSPETDDMYKALIPGQRVRYRLQRKQIALFKGTVRAHWRKLPSGKIVRVQEYTNKRTKKPQQAPARPESIQKTKEQIAEDSFTYGSGIFWRVHSKGKPLDPNAESWPWGMSREEAEELDLVLPGVSCMSNPEELVGYWEARGGVDDNLGEVVVFSGRLLDVPDEGDVAVPERELFRIPYSRVKAAVDADDYSLLDAPPPSTASGSPPRGGVD